MNVLRSGNTLRLSGRLNESANVREMFDTIQEIGLEGAASRPVVLDFSKLEHGNSIGLRNLTMAKEQCDIPLRYRGCPYWLVEQFNMMPDLLTGGVEVETFEIPLYSEESDEVTFRMVTPDEVTRWIDEMAASSEQSFTIQIDGCTYGLDEEPEMVFYFFKHLQQKTPA